MNGHATWLSFAAVSGPAKMSCGGPGLIGVFTSSTDNSIWPIEPIERVGSLDFGISGGPYVAEEHQSARAPPLECAIRVNRMSKKYAGAKQTEDCSNCFNHFDAP